MLVVGLGCARQPPGTMEALARWYEERTGVRTEVMCDPSTARTLRNVAAAYCSRPVAPDTNFVRQVRSRVSELLINGFRVDLAGVSYGGSVVVRVARMFDAAAVTDPWITHHLPRLRASTYGSTLVPRKHAGPHPAVVRVRHYMRPDDVALRCNGLRPGDALAPGHSLWWVRTPGAPPAAARRAGWLGRVRARLARALVPFGSPAEWRAHGSYHGEVVRHVRDGA